MAAITSSFCRCFCGKDMDCGWDPAGSQKAFGNEFDSLYEIDHPPTYPQPNADEHFSYAVSVDQPMRGAPVRQGKLWYLLAEQKIELVDFYLYVNGFSFVHDDQELSIALSPFTLVRNCKFQETYSNSTLTDMKIFKVSLFTQSLCYYYGVRGGSENEAEEERQRWVVELSKAANLVTQSLFPPFSISCCPVSGVSSTHRRLMAGYILYHDSCDVVSAFYCELHPNCETQDMAKMILYENESCLRPILEIRLTVGTVCCEKIGVNCTCFCIDGHQFAAQSCSERKLWLRAISNVKVKLQNRAPTPSNELLQHYRDAIEEHLLSLRENLSSTHATIDPLLPRVSKRSAQQGESSGAIEDGRLPLPEAPTTAFGPPGIGTSNALASTATSVATVTPLPEGGRLSSGGSSSSSSRPVGRSGVASLSATTVPPPLPQLGFERDGQHGPQVHSPHAVHWSRGVPEREYWEEGEGGGGGGGAARGGPNGIHIHDINMNEDQRSQSPPAASESENTRASTANASAPAGGQLLLAAAKAAAATCPDNGDVDGEDAAGGGGCRDQNHSLRQNFINQNHSDVSHGLASGDSIAGASTVAGGNATTGTNSYSPSTPASDIGSAAHQQLHNNQHQHHHLQLPGYHQQQHEHIQHNQNMQTSRSGDSRRPSASGYSTGLSAMPGGSKEIPQPPDG